MAITAQDIVDQVASRLGLDQAAAENTVGTILSVIYHEAEGTKVEALFDKIPGARDLAQRYDVMATDPNAGGGGLMDMLGSALGERAGALIHGVSRLRKSGLSVEQVRQAGEQFFQQVEAAAGPGLMKEIKEQVPGMAGHLGA
ncbi:MAG: hypothetical protein ACTHLC_04285 [Rhizobiaceae bacterium]